MIDRVTSLILAAAITACTFWGLASPRAASAATGTFETTSNPGGGSILTGTLGDESLLAATAALLRQVHAALGTRPKVVQAAQNQRDHSLALLFTASHDGSPFTGVAIVVANPGAQAAGAALYDTSLRFHTTVGPMMQRLQHITNPTAAAGAKLHLDPPQPLVPHAFSDGTGSISVPSSWALRVAGGGSAQASAPGSAAQVSYNMHFDGLDPSNPRAQMFLRTASPLARQGFHGIVAPYTNDPVKAWTEMYEGLARQLGFQARIHITDSSPMGSGAASFTGTLGTGPKVIRFIAYAFVLPPNPMGLWQLSDSHIFLQQSQLPQLANTANAVLNSVRINFGAVAAQQSAIRQMFQAKFEAAIANDQAEDAQRQRQTDQALANDRAAQEGMHKQAVAMENYSLDRAVIVNVTTGRHSTVNSDFADTLVAGNANYRKVPASGLLRGVDY